ncbi:hypothetical protein BM1_10681 [Bipolaris maydis]|nr:hypothetical protein BM1_10681 [Bipolaris maydis]
MYRVHATLRTHQSTTTTITQTPAGDPNLQRATDQRNRTMERDPEQATQPENLVLCSLMAIAKQLKKGRGRGKATTWGL